MAHGNHASSGIGKAAAEAVALKGYHVILAGRSMASLYQVAEELQRHHKSIMVEVLVVDVSSTDSIIRFVETVAKLVDDKSLSLQLLINNAGILATTERITAEGYDSMIMTNYLGHYLLTRLLLPILQRSRVPARIVNVGSFTHRCVKGSDHLFSLLSKRELPKNEASLKNKAYQIAHIYEASKLFMVMFTYELHHRLCTETPSMRITALVADPGIVHTAIFRELPRWFSTCIFLLLRCTWLLQSSEVGCRAVVDAAFAPLGCSAKYFFGGQGRVLATSPLSCNKQLANDLWILSERLFSDTILGTTIGGKNSVL
ncbi:hypothetical protein KP509_06G077500 [Ceratopteris richardii]|uniref:Uncharacterized protein n=1 Tax=Ceratopteris richardii TaxID=49495 RepID=A0A8T2UQA9_CERRI|nr:hypothetical protein KP509_06G077500 [Ceratopteris richardii]